MVSTVVSGIVDRTIRTGSSRVKVRNMVLVALYRLESRVGITPGEARALLFVAILLVGGVSVQYAVDTARARLADSPVQISWPPHRTADGLDMLSALDSARSAESDVITMTAAGDRVGINTASSEELQRLPGIGPAIAERIIEYRARYGLFRSVDELTAVKGIGPKTFAKLESQIVLNADDR
jgi:comEA protein